MDFLVQPKRSDVVAQNKNKKSKAKSEQTKNPFLIISNIDKKGGLLHPEFVDHHFNPFVTNMMYGRRNEAGNMCVIVANELNARHQMPKYEQYRCLYHRIPKNPNRYGAKVDIEEPKYIEAVMDYFGYTSRAAKEAITSLSEDELKKIQYWVDNKKGGLKK